MFEIKITDSCARCGENISGGASFYTHESYSGARKISKKYNKHLEQYPVWHHKGFSDYDGEYLTLRCNKCGAEYFLKTGPISLYCHLNNEYEIDESILDAEEIQKTKETTFLNWLKNQQGRGDMVGDFASECFYADDSPQGTRQKEYRENRSWPKRANSYREWINFLEEIAPQAITYFKIAWSEYLYLRHPNES